MIVNQSFSGCFTPLSDRWNKRAIEFWSIVSRLLFDFFYRASIQKCLCLSTGEWRDDRPRRRINKYSY